VIAGANRLGPLGSQAERALSPGLRAEVEHRLNVAIEQLGGKSETTGTHDYIRTRYAGTSPELATEGTPR
jgi:hypothetical protein